jgi:hypothetical protein
MIVDINLENEFIPEWNNNKKEDQPIKVIYRTPSMSHVERLIPKPSYLLKTDAEGRSQGAEVELTVDTKKMILALVIDIQNLEITNTSGTKTKIKNPQDLYTEQAPACLSGLADEIGVFLQGKLSAKVDETKN